ncbi:tRNA (adenosine(37)-N6)-threonylcarbamoyltransferase complex ATPase subunit type 1 TsaE [Hymenobacter sp. UV11]|uniref:tRNA (adenosine(37)-N6)-threonylcarbamoyltransferase complex ATPase subunit type 1 TsaE n=1 Tax=Hymenobacter sp. UV11 TaxID=1849735 RepID=UPI00105ED408|nr:tRNA (adenosine(37)-N6)-threonylcarbamoyltransferase complex ATPase subunit type 1 TsaE [Hymenobacter sp. UV11]TDN39460.1 tRNA (N6-adenosine(37)-N6)-threonylcarbamoyltransferase complex ATPase TsaE [Hymenobacter sp. UV11]TFZ65448.1 tRNA (adenosine(37)-N6)-threonylcarbamoyltransferase complex ATPase subunit type 1 TsaE [Hymenobacter sp. UV11]
MNTLTLEIPTLAALPTAAQQLATALAESGQTIVAFEGDMGAGKTTLIRALCAELGVGDDVSSPTFALVNEYRGGRGEPIYHFDFYRLDSEEEAARLGVAEYFDSGYLCLLEWPSRVASLLPPQRLLVELTATGPESRQIQLTIIN